MERVENFSGNGAGVLTSALGEALAAALCDVVAQVQPSLVSVHTGRRGVGAGFLWREDGLIITNNHVAAGSRLWVAFADGKESPASLLAQDPWLDLALLKVDRPTAPAARLGDSRRLRVGEIVLAIGHPWGQRDTVTMGIVSGFGQARVRGKQITVDVIRSDVLLAPGNSGGPLVDARGNVIGINTMIVGGDLGVAVPAHVVAEFTGRALAGAQAETTPASPYGQAWPSQDTERVL